MKHIPFLLLASFSMAFSQEPAPEPAKEKTEQAPEKPKPPVIRFKGKKGVPDSCRVTATRSGKAGDIRLVAMAPSNDATTRKSMPRLWWYQSKETAARDLVFTLSRVDERNGKIIIQQALPAMRPGFNVFDLADIRFNRGKHSLEDGATYQWTVMLVEKGVAPQVFCRMKVALPPADAPEPGLEELSESGNWYELFDAVCTDAEGSGEGSAVMTAARTEIISDVGLEKLIKAP